MMKTMVKRSVLAVMVACSAMACAETETGSQVRNVDEGLLVQHTDLRDMLPAGATLTGFTVEPTTGRRLVLDANRGIYAIADGEAELIWSVEQIPVGVEVNSAFTDFVAIGEGHFALTAISDGYLLELATGRFFQHFCYEPDFIPDPFIEPEVQVTRAVAFDAATDLLYAQPQTFNEGNLQAPLESLFSSYDLATGTDLTWDGFADADFSVGAMLVERSGSMLMGAGSQLYRYSIDDAILTPLADLTALGIHDIEGLALDHTTQTVLVVSEGQLFELRPEAIRAH